MMMSFSYKPDRHLKTKEEGDTVPIYLVLMAHFSKSPTFNLVPGLVEKHSNG